MNLSPYLDSLRQDLAAAAAPGGEQAVQTAHMLVAALNSAARLCLIEALADAAAEITTKLDGPTVEVRIHGREAELVVTRAYDEGSSLPPPVAVEPGGEPARLTLRLPENLKEAIEKAASAEGLSVNAWLVRAAATALRQPPAGTGSSYGRRFTGFAQA